MIFDYSMTKGLSIIFLQFFKISLSCLKIRVFIPFLYVVRGFLETLNEISSLFQASISWKDSDLRLFIEGIPIEVLYWLILLLRRFI